jgi:methionyl-tRNA formyltransferase
LNIHASLLPRWRGAAPIHRAIMAGDQTTGVCITQMDAGLDTGSVRIRRSLDIGASETTAQLHDRLAVTGSTAVVDVLADLAGHACVPQVEEGLSYATKVDKLEARIDWTRSAVEIDRQIRGLSPFPGAWCMMDDQRLKVLASCLSDGAGVPGQVLQASEIACGDGSVILTTLQQAGKTAQTAEAFFQGHSLPELLE